MTCRTPGAILAARPAHPELLPVRTRAYSSTQSHNRRGSAKLCGQWSGHWQMPVDPGVCWPFSAPSSLAEAKEGLVVRGQAGPGDSWYLMLLPGPHSSHTADTWCFAMAGPDSSPRGISLIHKHSGSGPACSRLLDEGNPPHTPAGRTLASLCSPGSVRCYAAPKSVP